MGKIFLTSDTHFGHDREFLWGPRGFISHVEHDRQVIENWNSIVEPDDIVYHLGDVMLGDTEYGMSCLAQLNGHIKIIRGNHDTDRRWALYATLPNVELIGWAEVIKYKKYQFYLSHHPTITSNLDKAPYLKMHLINLLVIHISKRCSMTTRPLCSMSDLIPMTISQFYWMMPLKS